MVDDRPDLLWPSFTPRVPERVQDHDGDMFAAIRQKDMLLHHPYETFDMVIRFLQPGGARPQCRGDQADALPHLQRIPDRRGAVRGGRERQIGDRAGRTEGPLRRGRQHPPVAQAGTVRRACGLRLHQLQDPRQDQHRGAARGRPAGHLHPLRHRQLPPDHRAHLHRPEPVHLRRRAGARCDQGLQLCRRLRRTRAAGKPRRSRR